MGKGKRAGKPAILKLERSLKKGRELVTKVFISGKTALAKIEWLSSIFPHLGRESFRDLRTHSAVLGACLWIFSSRPTQESQGFPATRSPLHKNRFPSLLRVGLTLLQLNFKVELEAATR